MTKREVIKLVLDGGKPPYVPWSFKFTKEPLAMLLTHFGTEDLDLVLGNHLLQLGNDIGFFEEIAPDHWRDFFGVVWDRSVDKDIGVVANQVLPEPTLAGYIFPDPCDDRFSSRLSRRQPASRTCSGSSRLAFRYMNGPGHCVESKIC